VVEHSLGVDTIALVAMVRALALGEELVGAVIGLMFSGGASLEVITSWRARRELTALIKRAPKVAQLRSLPLRRPRLAAQARRMSSWRSTVTWPASS
jgi:cation transport ATPase